MPRTRPYRVTYSKPDGRVGIEYDLFLCDKHARRARGATCTNGSVRIGTVTAIEAQGPAGESICESCDGGWRFEPPVPTGERPN